MKTILLVEDNEDDVFFLERAKIETGIENPLRVVRDGQDALDYFQGIDKFADREKFPLPFLVLLDLKLPFVPGMEVLKWIREQPEYKNILVVVLTSSQEDRDIDAAFRLGANFYLVKPPTPQMLAELVKALRADWILKI